MHNAREFYHSYHDNSEISISKLAAVFIQSSQQKKRISIFKQASILVIFPLIGTFFLANIALFYHAQKVITRESENCTKDRMMPLWVRYLILMNQEDKLEVSNFCEDDLRDINLSNAILWRSNFKSANLSRTDFTNAMLEEVDFQGAILNKTNFSGAYLQGAKFNGAFLYQAQLRTSSGLQESQFEDALICSVQLPEIFSLDSNRDCKTMGMEPQ